MIKFLVSRRILVFLAFVFGYLSFFYTENIFAKTISEVECKGTEEKLVYNCIITLTDQKTQKKILGANFTVGADMPSMPGAHNIRPVMANSIGLGIYSAILKLDMYGEWVLKMDFTKPKRNRIIKKLIFGGKNNENSHDYIGNIGIKKKKEMECHHNHIKEHKH